MTQLNKQPAAQRDCTAKCTLPPCGCNVQPSRQKDSEKPQWQLQVNPWTRYEQFSKQLEEKYKGALDDVRLAAHGSGNR